MSSFVSKADIKDKLLQEAATPLDGHNLQRIEYIIPILSGWVFKEEGHNIFILGTVRNHSKYPAGSRIRTSKVINFQKVNHRNIISTRNSMYELGDPAIQLQASAQDTYQDLQQRVNRINPDDIFLQDYDLDEFTKLSH